MRINLFNSNNPNGLRLSVAVNILHNDLFKTKDGEVVYIIQINPNLPDIKPVVIDNVTTKNIQSELKKGLSLIASQVDWGELKIDTKAPKVLLINPKENENNVSINSIVQIQIKDFFPTSLINPATLKLTANGVDVTNELNIKNLDQLVNITWIPEKVLK